MTRNTFHFLNHAQISDVSHKFVEFESKEDILDVFSGFDKELIFNILILIVFGIAFSEEFQFFFFGYSIFLID